MFYIYDILHKRGKFGIIWLAATSRCRINRRDITGVNVVGSSDDIISVLTEHEMLDRRKTRFSLYLSSQLMYGLLVVQSHKCKYLLEDVKTMLSTIHKMKIPIESNIDLKTSTDKDNNFKITFVPPDMACVSPDFGRLKPFPEPTEHLTYEYFIVHTPRSSEELVITPGSQRLDQAMFEPLPDGLETLHTSLREDITMQEADNEEPIPPEMPEEAVDLFAGPFAFDDMPQDVPIERETPPDLLPSPQHQSDDQPIPLPPQTSPPDQLPRAGRTPPHPDQPTPPDESPATPAAGEREVDAPGIAPVGVGSPSVRQSSWSSSADSFVLDPVRDPRRPRRRRRLIVDPVIVLPPQQMRNNIDRANDRLTIPLHRPGLLESADSLLHRLSTRLVPRHIQHLMNQLATLPEPDLDNFFDAEPPQGPVLPSPPVAAAEEAVPVEEGLIPIAENESDLEPAEIQRAASWRDGTLDPVGEGLLTSSSLRAAGVSSRTLTEDITRSPLPSMLQLDDDLDSMPLLQAPQRSTIEPHFEEDLMQDQPMEEVPLPEEESREEPRQRDQQCVWSPVSPLPDPPLSSYESITGKLDEVMDVIKSSAAQSMFAQGTSFTGLLEQIHPTNPSKRNVASLFNLLLHLHSKGRICLEQPPSGIEIFIKIAPEGNRGIEQ